MIRYLLLGLGLTFAAFGLSEAVGKLLETREMIWLWASLGAVAVVGMLLSQCSRE
jgi:hypothetical protein